MPTQALADRLGGECERTRRVGEVGDRDARHEVSCPISP
jgi:hypothetical protein